MRPKGMKCLGTGTVVMVLMIAGNFAGAVPTYLYDGTIGDADPTSQGFFTNLINIGATITPDPVNDLVHMVVPSTGLGDYQPPGHHAWLHAATKDDFYAWEFEAEMNMSTGHRFLEFRMITGTTSGSASWEDRMFFRNDADDGFGNFNDRIQFVGLTPDAGYGADTKPSTYPGGTGAWTTLEAKNLYRFERHDDAVSMWANGDLIWQGTGGSVTWPTASWTIKDNSTNVVDMDWYSLSIENLDTTPPLPTLPAWQPQTMYIAGTTDRTPLSAANITTYMDTWNASGAHSHFYTPTGMVKNIPERWSPADVPWVAWVSPGLEGLEGIVSESDMYGIPANLPGRIGYDIGGEPLTWAEIDEARATAAALKVYDPNGLVFVPINTDPTDAMVDALLSDPNIDVVWGHKYTSDNTYYADLERYRALGLAHDKPYWRYLQGFKGSGGTSFNLTKSDLRFKGFSSLTYGYTGLVWFIYNLDDPTDSQFFTTGNTYDYGSRQSPQFERSADLNAEMQIVGDVVVRLTSTATRLHLGDNAAYAQPTDTADWSAGAGGDPYIITIDQSTNDDMDILVGLFDDQNSENYFMLQNTLHSHGDTSGNTSGTILVEFDFTGVSSEFDKTNISRINRTTGLWELLPLTLVSGNTYSLLVTLPAGDADLFKYATNLPGDVNNDGVVDDTDLGIVIANWGTAGTRAQGDLNDNGVVDGPDYALVLSYYAPWSPSEPPGEAGGVPEPATIGLLLTGTILLLARRRQK